MAHSACREQRSLEGIESMTGEQPTTDTLLEMGQRYLGKVRSRSFTENCIFGFSLDDGSVVTTRHGYCHGNVMDPSVVFNTATHKPVAINTRIQKDSVGYDSVFASGGNGGLLPEDYFDEYYDFLFNQSVFRDCYVTKTTEGLRNGGVVVVRCDKGPANLMAAACVAIRRGWEYTFMSKSLVNMLRMGIEPNLAHLVSYQLTVDEDGSFEEVKYGDHQSIYSCYLDKSGVKNLREGRVPPSSKFNTKTYQELCYYRGLYGMWNNSGEKAYGKGKNPLKFIGSKEEYNAKRDPFGLIVRLNIKPRRTLQIAIEEGLQAL